MDETKIYGLISSLEEFVSDMRWTMQNLRRDDTDGEADVKRDLVIRVENCEGKLKELRAEIGKDK